MTFLGIPDAVKTMIRHAAMSDANAMQQLIAQAFPLACPPDISDADIRVHLANKCSSEIFKSYIASDKTTVIVACDGSNLLGFAILIFSETTSEKVVSALTSVASTAELSKFYVSPSQHGQGIAQKLMQRCFELVNELGWSALWLNVNQQNERANRFYEKMGFTIVGECDFILGSSIQKDFIRERFFTVAT
ncbi:MAG: GNAT family N-acetyltransferase [Actinobacteria bacterium]|nr:GNAT family N-acetyltransferase [Actinomycetota bacterium]